MGEEEGLGSEAVATATEEEGSGSAAAETASAVGAMAVSMAAVPGSSRSRRGPRQSKNARSTCSQTIRKRDISY